MVHMSKFCLTRCRYDADFFSFFFFEWTVVQNDTSRFKLRGKKVEECVKKWTREREMKIKRVSDVWTSNIQSGIEYHQMNRVTITDGMWFEWKIGVNGIGMCTHTIFIVASREIINRRFKKKREELLFEFDFFVFVLDFKK